MRKIGIMGGTFDPIHNGHLMLGEYAKARFCLDEIWFMPNGNPPHKCNESITATTNHRVEMVRLAIADRAGFVLQPYEVENEDVHYSYLTMEHLKKIYPDAEFYFIIGADSLFSLERWKCPERLVKTCILLAAYRDGRDTDEMQEQIALLNQKYDADIRLLQTPKVDVSSTDIRNRLKIGEAISSMIPETVLQYINRHHLYTDELTPIRSQVRQHQKKSRFVHTLGVAETSVRLAERYGADKKKAEIAGLLHDCAKELYPGLLHASEGAKLAQSEYSIEDKEILDAIRWHTTGRPEMTLLDKIIYVADYIEPNRSQAPNLDEIRRLAMKDLDECLYTILEATLAYLKATRTSIDTMTEKTYLYYKAYLKK